MCGICGIVNAGQKAEGIVRSMNAKLAHRGPDEEGYHFDDRVAFGMRRLSIIDLKTGHQPIFNENRNVMVICNGEIYNFRELRAELEKKGHKFYTKSDTEVIVHAYEAYGEDFIKRLWGMFGLALWDKEQKKLILARDRVGKKPLLYACINGRLYFSSEFQSILRSPEIDKRDMDYTAIDFYLTFGYIPAPMTIFKGIKKVMPGHMLIYKDNKTEERCYWSPEYSTNMRMSEVEAAERILDILKDAVKIRMISDVPLGAFLSGGIDSSTVVALMSQLSTKPIKTFSIGFEEGAFSELRHARRVAERYHTDHKEMIVRPDILELIPTLVRHYGEPYADSSAVPSYYLSKMTRQHVTVALNGDGGDESFGGYQRYFAAKFSRYIHTYLPFLKYGQYDRMADRLSSGLVDKFNLLMLRDFLTGALKGEEYKRYKYWVSIFNPSQNGMYSDTFIEKIDTTRSDKWFDGIFNSGNGLDIVKKSMRTDLFSYLPYDLLVKVDIVSMANSLEARSPFLDHRLIEFAASLGSNFKIRGTELKYILKRCIKGIVPDENVYRQKMGFGMPLKHWFKGELKSYLTSKVLSKRAIGRGYFKPESIRDTIDEHERGRRDNSIKLWTLLMLESWHEEFID